MSKKIESITILRSTMLGGAPVDVGDIVKDFDLGEAKLLIGIGKAKPGEDKSIAVAHKKKQVQKSKSDSTVATLQNQINKAEEEIAELKDQLNAANEEVELYKSETEELKEQLASKDTKQ